MSRLKIAVSIGAAVAAVGLVSLGEIQTISEDTELRDLDVAVWDCANQPEGTAQSEDAKERNRMKNRWPVNLSLFTVEPLDTAAFLKKVREYDSQLRSNRRGELTAAQKNQLDRYENQILSLSGWLVIAYAGMGETTNCGSPIFHD